MAPRSPTPSTWSVLGANGRLGTPPNTCAVCGANGSPGKLPLLPTPLLSGTWLGPGWNCKPDGIDGTPPTPNTCGVSGANGSAGQLPPENPWLAP